MNWIDYYFLGGTPVLPWLGRIFTQTVYVLLIGICLGWMVAKIKLLPSWLSHWAELMDALNPHTKGGLGETQQKLEVIEQKLDDLSQTRPD